MLCCCCYRYLANDMQFFLTSPIIIFALWKHRKVGLGLLATLLVALSPLNSLQMLFQVSFTVIPTVLGFVNNWGFSTQVHLHFQPDCQLLGFPFLDLGWWKSQYGGLP